jgi:hypothetical protein
MSTSDAMDGAPLEPMGACALAGLPRFPFPQPVHLSVASAPLFRHIQRILEPSFRSIQLNS